MDYININGYTIPYPNDFQMRKVPNKVASITTMSGKTLSDINGWKYDNTTLQWDTLLDSDLSNMLAAISGSQFELTFTNIDGETETVNAILESRVSTKTRRKHNGKILWKDINVEVSFPDCYHD